MFCELLLIPKSTTRHCFVSKLKKPQLGRCSLANKMAHGPWWYRRKKILLSGTKRCGNELDSHNDHSSSPASGLSIIIWNRLNGIRGHRSTLPLPGQLNSRWSLKDIIDSKRSFFILILVRRLIRLSPHFFQRSIDVSFSWKILR